jgi:hypothetical protein
VPPFKVIELSPGVTVAETEGVDKDPFINPDPVQEMLGDGVDAMTTPVGNILV